jgi:hypothetical protein
MTKRDKQEQKIRDNPGNVALEDFEALIKQYGVIKTKGNHPKARINNYTLPYVRENPVKTCYVKDLLQIIDSL